MVGLNHIYRTKGSGTLGVLLVFGGVLRLLSSSPSSPLRSLSLPYVVARNRNCPTPLKESVGLSRPPPVRVQVVRSGAKLDQVVAEDERPDEPIIVARQQPVRGGRCYQPVLWAVVVVVVVVLVLMFLVDVVGDGIGVVSLLVLVLLVL